MTIKKLNINDFPKWSDYYFNYQKNLASDYYIPLLNNWDIIISSKQKILDIGCGDGGFISAFADLGCDCTGIEIRDFKWKKYENINYIIGDITHAQILKQLKRKWNLIILRDVIEHIPERNKINFINSISKIMMPDTYLLITFPPFYSPYGLHQQVLAKSFLKYIPYLSWVPQNLLVIILKLLEKKENLSEIKEIYDCKMTIKGFKKLIKKSDFYIINNEKYHVRPSHQIRYGIKLRKATNWSDLPFLREGIITGCTYLTKKII